MKKALVCGAGGFIGHHLVKQLRENGFWVRGVDLKHPEFSGTQADEFIIGDLREKSVCQDVCDQRFSEIYQLAADMGGAGYVFVEDNDADIMHNSALINLNMLEMIKRNLCGKVFYSSSACVYPKHNQIEAKQPVCSEDSVYPADPDSEYGWEKLFSERLYMAFAKNHGISVRIARFHNVFGEEGVYDGGREKSPAALCRKIASVPNGGEIEIWGDGRQTRSFLYIDECLKGVRRLMDSDFCGPVNIGSDEMVSINQLADIISTIAHKKIRKKYVDGPLGVRGRNSDNRLIKEKLGWAPSQPLVTGLKKTYMWIEAQIQQKAGDISMGFSNVS